MSRGSVSVELEFVSLSMQMLDVKFYMFYVVLQAGMVSMDWVL